MGELAKRIAGTSGSADYFTHAFSGGDGQKIIIPNKFRRKMDGKAIKIYGGTWGMDNSGTPLAFLGTYIKQTSVRTFALEITETSSTITVKSDNYVLPNGILLLIKED